MSEKTKPINPWYFAGLLTVILTVGVGFRIDSVYRPDDWLIKIVTSLFIPAADFLSLSVSTALEQLRGDKITPLMVNISILFVMAGMFFLLFIAPWMLVTGSKNDPETGKPVKSKRWYAATPVILTAIIMALMAGIVTTFTFVINKSAIADGHERDTMRQELMNVSLNAASVVFLPQENGGGDGLFTGFTGDVNGEVRDIRLDDLDRYDPDSEYLFRIEAIIDSILIMKIENRDGNEQFTADVSPYDDPVFRLN